jgi:hypothetical protein
MGLPGHHHEIQALWTLRRVPAGLPAKPGPYLGKLLLKPCQDIAPPEAEENETNSRIHVSCHGRHFRVFIGSDPPRTHMHDALNAALLLP